MFDRKHEGFSAAAIFMGANVLSALVPFILLPILTRFMPPEEFGTVAIFQAFVTALAAVVGLSVHTAAARKYYEDGVSDEEVARYIGACFAILGTSTALTLLLILTFSGKVSKYVGLDLGLASLAVACSAAMFAGNIWMSQLQARRLALAYGGFQVSRALLNGCLSILFVALLLLGAEGRIWAIVLSYAVFAVFSAWRLGANSLLAFRVRAADVREALAFSIPLIPHVVAGFLLTSFDRFVITDKLGLAQTGLYFAGVQIAAAMGMAVDAAMKAYTPWLYDRLNCRKPEGDRLIVRVVWVSALALLAAAGLSFLFAKPATVVVLGPAYRAAADVIGWLILGQALNGIAGTFSILVYHSKRTGVLASSTFSSALAHIALVFPLVEAFGIRGAAMAYALARLLKLVVVAFAATRMYKLPWF